MYYILFISQIYHLRLNVLECYSKYGWESLCILSAEVVEQAKEYFKTCTVTLHVIETWMLFMGSSPQGQDNLSMHILQYIKYLHTAFKENVNVTVLLEWLTYSGWLFY